jgi:hypothetical protein
VNAGAVASLASNWGEVFPQGLKPSFLGGLAARLEAVPFPKIIDGIEIRIALVN